GLGQPHGLAGDVLIASRHPRIADNGAHGVWQTTVLWTGRGCGYRPRLFPSTKYVPKTCGVHNPDRHFRAREDLSWRADRCSRTKNDGCFSASRTTPTDWRGNTP